MKTSLAERLKSGGYDGYAYGYPHKTAYRALTPPVPLSEAWREEDKQHLFLYVHLPFCEMRCGFCNLFTAVNPGDGLVERTLRAIDLQSRAVAEAIGPARVAQAAIGGGTPSFLSETELERLFQQLAQGWDLDWAAIAASFEVSPGTVSREKLALLRRIGIERISLGVQSFVPEDLVALNRPQPPGELERACRLIKDAGFPVFNLDLIYGAAGQDLTRWRLSLDRTLEWRPEEIYLYPLYVGKLTGLDRRGRRPDEGRRELYLFARDLLIGAGYRQISMRLFRRADVRRHTDYCCQEDGMVGLGPGARSYTRALHYSTEYAVGQGGVKKIIEDYNARPAATQAQAVWGVALSESEQRRRYVIKSLLRADGLSLAAYQARFGTAVMEDLPDLSDLSDLGLMTEQDGTLKLTAEGLAWSDTIGPWLYSEAMTARMDECSLA